MLKLLNAELARTYGLPARDLTEAEALDALTHLGDNAAQHLADAIDAGAFEIVESDSNEVKNG